MALGALTAAAVGVGAGILSPDGTDPAARPTRPPQGEPVAPAAAPATPLAAAPSAPSDPSPPAPRAVPVAVDIPERGPGTFRIASGRSEVSGEGSLLTYTVEVERGLPLRVREIAATVDATLADPRGWTTAEDRSVQRVGRDGDLRILIATPETTDGLCAPLDTGGRLSCRNGERVVLNAWRWVHGADAYDGIAQYRRYLVNHEVGHALGNGHVDCAEPGALAPVMLQQTKGLQGCRRNPWPAP
ncbi:DUF3152 domain-containing protein [Nocardioides sp. LHD-245]|uniref:DUF3152 domain-containing protein n=1 Tax=Nocardioides sp. LHD-245 TaxID=3051387 RepID=UPI0027E1181F|nr:DUF3152 domain-containing protein [Nocardioides sp. LHD-245]